MRVHLKAWQTKDKGPVQDINLRLTGKELDSITLDIQGQKYQLMESKGKLYVMTTNGQALLIEPSTANSLYIRYKND